MNIFLLLFGYIIGSIPFGLVFTRLAGRGDIRNFGSGNIGATNVVRRAGKFWGFLTLICDIGKGALAVYISSLYNQELAIYVGMMAIIGHVFPIWLNFKGGKAVATSIAVWLFIDLQLGLLIIATWLVTFVLFRISSLAAIIAFTLAPIYAYFLDLDSNVQISSILVSALVLFRHKANFSRILKGEE